MRRASGAGGTVAAVLLWPLKGLEAAPPGPSSRLEGSDDAGLSQLERAGPTKASLPHMGQTTCVPNAPNRTRAGCPQSSR